MMRLGIVFFTLSMTWLYERKWKPERSVMAMLGQESLFVYAFHLLIVYGSQFTSHSFARDIGRTLTVLPSLTLTIALILFTGAIAVAWHYWKQNHSKSARLFFYALCVIYFAVFFSR
jgi:fucose 4-O-acetylase-like acetyltransferase